MPSEDKKKDIIAQLEDLLQKAIDHLHDARQQRIWVEDLLAQAKEPENIHKRVLLFENAQTAVLAAEEADSQIKHILQQAHDLVQTDEESSNRPFLYIREIKELKQFSDIVNVEGEAAEEAFTARMALNTLKNLL